MKKRNPNYTQIRYNIDIQKKRGIVLEGSSRSGKTWSIIFYIFRTCLYNRDAGLTFNIIKETYAGFKTTLYDDFNKILSGRVTANPFAVNKDIQSFNLFGNKIQFIGADQSAKFHGAGCDYFWMNEGLDVSQAIFDQLEMRCRVAWIIDYNPKVSDHWIFNRIGKRDDVKFFHSTMLDNPYVGVWEKKKIMGYEPTPENIAAGTADDYMWKVYGLGLRASPQGVVFPNVEWIDTFPVDIEEIAYGLDFGYTNSPTATAKVGRNGRNLYIEKLFYAPVDNAADLSIVVQKCIGDSHIWADSADPGMIADLRRRDISAHPVGKFAGSIKYGIDLMKQYKIHVVRDADARREFENYKWREINGISLNEPVDDYNHLIDAARYAVLMQFRKE